MKHRPGTVRVIAMFLFAAAAIAAVVAASLLFPGTALDRLWDLNRPAAAAFHALGPASGVLLLVVGAAALAGAVGLMRGRRWAWWVAVVLFSVDGLGDAVSVFATGNWLKSAAGLMISGAFVYSLCRKGVMRFFES